MIRKIVFLALILVLWSMAAPVRRGGFDAVSAASGGGGGTADKGQSSQSQHPSYALRVILDAEGKRQSAKLSAQIDSCYQAVQTLESALRSGQFDFDAITLYLIVEEHDGLKALWSGVAQEQIQVQVRIIDEGLTALTAFLEIYDGGAVDAASVAKILRVVDDIAVQYRIIQWKLYL